MEKLLFILALFLISTPLYSQVDSIPDNLESMLQVVLLVDDGLHGHHKKLSRLRPSLCQSTQNAEQ